jgi:hypothetical protein
MPILQGGNPTGDIIGGLLNAAGQYFGAQQQAKLAKQKRQDVLNQQAIQNALAQKNFGLNQSRVDIEAQNAGLVKGPDGNYIPDPRLAGALAGLAGGDTGTTGLVGGGAPQAPSAPPKPQGTPGGFAQTTGYGQQPSMQADPRFAGALAGLGAAAPQAPVIPKTMSPQDYVTAANDQFAQADKIEKQIASLVGIPGTSAQNAIRTLQAEAQQHRERGNTLLGQSDRATTQITAEQEQAARAKVDAFMQNLHTPKFKSPQEALGYYNNRYQAALGLPESQAKKDALESIKAQVDEAQKAVDAITKSQLTDYQKKRLAIEQQNANRPRAVRTPSARDVYFQTHGYDPPTYSEAHPHDKPTPVVRPRNLSSSEQREFAKAVSRLPKPDPGGAALQALAKQWNMPLDQAASYVP